MSAAAEPLSSVFEHSRRRLQSRTVVTVISTTLAVGAIAYLLSTAVEAAGQLGLIDLPAPVPSVQMALAAAALAAAIASLFAAWTRRSLRPKQLALSIDRRAEMGLAYATALEFAGQTEAGPVAGALVSETQTRAQKLDMRELWPLIVPTARNLLITSLVAAGVALTLNIALPPPNASRSEAATIDSSQTREDAQELADRLNREAVLRQDPLLAAIAKAIEERVADAAPDVSADDLNSELDALTEQARSAFGENAPSWLNDRRKAGQMPAGSNVATGASGPQNPDLQQGDDEFAISLEDIESARRNQEIAVLEADGRSPGEESEAMGEIRPGDNKPPGSAMTPEKIEPQQMQFAGRESVGAAAESGKGPADQAGAGTRELEGETMTDGAGGEAPMALPQAAQETGRRIRITLPPSEAEQAMTDSQGGAAGSNAGGPSTQTVERPTAPAGSRAALARYFERLAE